MKAAVSEIIERLWAEYEVSAPRSFGARLVYLFVDGIAERLRPGQRREAVLVPGASARTDARSSWG
jgi:putative transposase